MSRSTYTAFALGTLSVVAAPRPAEPRTTAASGFAVRYRNVISPDRVRTLTVLPGETVSLEVVAPTPGSGYVARPAAGLLVPMAAGRWVWTAPPAPGLYPIQVVAPDGSDSVTVQAFVVVPYDRFQGELLNGYRIGRYPAKPLRGLASYSLPAGLVEVTPENEDILVSPHFPLKQFLCKEPGGSRKYIVLNERLLVALEYLLARVHEAGYRATTFHVMSGYRTPAYNLSLGNVRYSQHQLGAAADIFIDEHPADGKMDDLNHDGRTDRLDAQLLRSWAEQLDRTPQMDVKIGGLSDYGATETHGPFVHVDARGYAARW